MRRHFLAWLAALGSIVFLTGQDPGCAQEAPGAGVYDALAQYLPVRGDWLGNRAAKSVERNLQSQIDVIREEQNRLEDRIYGELRSLNEKIDRHFASLSRGTN